MRNAIGDSRKLIEEFLMAAMDHVWNTSVVGRKVKDEVESVSIESDK